MIHSYIWVPIQLSMESQLGGSILSLARLMTTSILLGMAMPQVWLTKLSWLDCMMSITLTTQSTALSLLQTTVVASGNHLKSMMRLFKLCKTKGAFLSFQQIKPHFQNSTRTLLYRISKIRLIMIKARKLQIKMLLLRLIKLRLFLNCNRIKTSPGNHFKKKSGSSFQREKKKSSCLSLKTKLKSVSKICRRKKFKGKLNMAHHRNSLSL